MSIQNPNVAQKGVLPIDDTAAAPSLAIGNPLSGNGIYGDYSEINVAIGGVDKLTINSSGISAVLKSADGSAGLTQDVSVLDPDGVTTIVLSFKNGLLTGVA